MYLFLPDDFVLFYFYCHRWREAVERKGKKGKTSEESHCAKLLMPLALAQQESLTHWSEDLWFIRKNLLMSDLPLWMKSVVLTLFPHFFWQDRVMLWCKSPKHNRKKLMSCSITHKNRIRSNYLENPAEWCNSQKGYNYHSVKSCQYKKDKKCGDKMLELCFTRGYMVLHQKHYCDSFDCNHPTNLEKKHKEGFISALYISIWPVTLRLPATFCNHLPFVGEYILFPSHVRGPLSGDWGLSKNNKCTCFQRYSKQNTTPFPL